MIPAKSHLLKLCYTVAKWSADGGENPCRKNGRRSSGSEKDLMRVFASRGLAGLTARNRGNAHARVEASMEGDGVPEGMGNLVFDFQAGHEEEGLSIREMPRRFLNVPVVFLAAREVLTIYPSFVQVGSRFPRISGRRQLGPLPLSGYGGGSGAHQYGCRARGCQAGKKSSGGRW